MYENENYERDNEKIENKQTEQSPERKAFEERNRYEAEQNRLAINGGQEAEGGNKNPNAGNENNIFKNFEPLEGLTPKLDHSIGEQIAKDALESEFPKCEAVQLDSDHLFDKDNWEGGVRPDFLIVDANHESVGVAEVKTHTGELSNEVIDKAYEQLVNGAENFEVDRTSFVSIDQEGRVDIFNCTLQELKDMKKEDFRDFVRSRD